VINSTGWPQFGKKKIQGLFKDLKLTFSDLFRQRFCEVTEVLVMTSYKVSNTN